MKVKCIDDDMFAYIQKGKVYNADITEDKGYYIIMNDIGQLSEYEQYCFEVVKEDSPKVLLKGYDPQGAPMNLTEDMLQVGTIIKTNVLDKVGIVLIDSDQDKIVSYFKGGFDIIESLLEEKQKEDTISVVYRIKHAVGVFIDEGALTPIWTLESPEVCEIHKEIERLQKRLDELTGD